MKLSGGREAFYRRTPEERASLRKTARRLQAHGAAYEAFAREHEAKSDEGFVYAVSHPAWPGVYKVGFASNVISRLNSFQTGCPQRAYKLEHCVAVRQRARAERYVHGCLAPHRLEGEWFRIDLRIITSHLRTIEDTP